MLAATRAIASGAGLWFVLFVLGASPATAQVESVVQAPPQLAAYLDTTSLYTALARVPRAHSGKRASQLFRIEFDSTGQPQAPVPAIPRAMPRPYRDAVGPLIQAALRPIYPRRGGWECLILVKTGEQPSVEEAFPPEQPPRILNPSAVSGALYRTAQRLMRADPKLAGKAVAIHVALTVNEDGVGAAPRLVASSGLAALDEAVLRVIQTIRFTPGLLDGEPAPARAVLPFRVVFSDE